MTPVLIPSLSRTPFTKLSAHDRFKGYQNSENVLGILQEVEKSLREELAAVEEISWKLRPIIRSPLAKSKFTWRCNEDSVLKDSVPSRNQSKPSQNDLECGDSLHISDSTCIRSWTKTSSESETKYSDGDSSRGTSTQKTSTKLKPAESSSATICVDSNDDIRAPLHPRKQSPLESREQVRSGHASSQGHPDSLNRRGVALDHAYDHNTAWLIDAVHILKEYYLKKTRLRLEAEPSLRNALPAPVLSSVVSLPSVTYNKASQTPPVICAPVHTSPCGHFQWTATDRISPDIAFYISPFDPEDNLKISRAQI